MVTGGHAEKSSRALKVSRTYDLPISSFDIQCVLQGPVVPKLINLIPD